MKTIDASKMTLTEYAARADSGEFTATPLPGNLDLEEENIPSEWCSVVEEMLNLALPICADFSVDGIATIRVYQRGDAGLIFYRDVDANAWRWTKLYSPLSAAVAEAERISAECAS